jgi:hypothetical protein
MDPKTYKVTGAQRINGTEPGDTFKAVLPPLQEARLLRRGAIKIEGGRTPSARLPREELDDLAREAQVHEPQNLPTKQAVIEAIEATYRDQEV